MAVTPALRFLTVAMLAAVSVSAQASPVEVKNDRIVVHDEFIPRFTDLPRVLVVPAGETVTLPPESTWDAIEVAGTLRVSRTHDTTCRFIHLTILPGGTLDAGTVDDPVLRRVEFIVRDVPIDTGRDPYQWGNGLINLGHQSRVGRRLERSWTELAEDVEAGATTLRLAVPAGWQVGDELFLPDLRQIHWPNAPVRREARVTIAALDGDTIRLSAPLTFEHRAIRDPAGAIVVRPRVANLTRNIVIRSENPAGTRGHTVNTGAATWDIRYNALIGLGRTRAETLDSTTADPATGAITHVGTNQIARYASHDHHVQLHAGSAGAAHGHAAGAVGGRFIGNVLENAGDGKWGHVIHGTHDTLVEENIALGFVGAGFVTEDGYEVRNVFRRNVAAFSKGNGISAIGNIDPPRGRNCPGCEGAGFWFRGLHQTIEENEAWNNKIGLNLFAMHQVKGRQVPSGPGAKPDTPLDPRSAHPVAMADNVTLSNTETGLEYWGTTRFPVVRALSAHNGRKQVFAGQSNVHLWLQSPTIVASGARTDGVSTTAAYVLSFEMDGGRVVGCKQAFQRGGSLLFFRLRNVTLQCATNINFAGRTIADESLYENVMHVPLGNHPKRFLVLGSTKVWQPGETLTRAAARVWLPGGGARHTVKNWQGTGQDYHLYERQQLASAPAWPANGAYGTVFFCPEAGLTMGECWERYGLAYRGGVVQDEAAVPLEGLLNGVASAGLAIRLGVPRAVLTTPNMIAPAKTRMTRNGQRVRLTIALTGDPDRANRVAIVQIDDRQPERHVRGTGQHPDEISFYTDAASEGTHTVRTWREDPAGQPIAESELRFGYVVPGATTENGEPQPGLPQAEDPSPAPEVALPAGFAESLVIDGLDRPTAMALAPDGRLFVAEQAGAVRVLREGQLLDRPFLTLNVQADGERGLLGLAIDPAFHSNGFVYVYYTTAGPEVRTRISRFASAGDVADPTSELILLERETPATSAAPTGGALAFDPDGRLFVGVPAGEMSGTASPGGMLLQIATDGSMPAGDAGEWPGFVWAAGFRQPVSVSFHRQTGTMLIGEERLEGLSEIYDGRAAADDGGSGPGDGPSQLTRRYRYQHGGPADCRLTSGTFYEPGLALFPAEYHDAYFFADSCTGTIRRLDLWDDRVVPFATNVASVRDLEVSADGSLYYLSRNAAGGGGRVARIAYAAQDEPAVTGPVTAASETQAGAAAATVTAASETQAGAAAATVTAASRIVVANTSQLNSALSGATPGTVIALSPGVYSGGLYKAFIAGTSTQPIVIEAADPANKPIIRGGYNGLQFSDVSYLTIRNLIFEGQSQNGLNIDDKDTFSTPSHHITLSGLVVRNVENSGNADAIKLSGVQDFVIENSTISNWGGGSAIDMVGCHRGEIRNNVFRHGDFAGATGPQMKGGSTRIVIRHNRFEHAGVRAVQIGGTTGLSLFRPQPPAGYEAKDCLVEHNVFIGSEAAVAFVNVDGSTFRFNTVYRPRKWVVRILQETRADGFVPSRRGVVTDNIIYWQSPDLPYGPINVGSATDAASFTFARNWWYRADRPSASKPSLPSPETGGVYGVDPQFVDASSGDLRLSSGSPASAYGAYAGGSEPSPSPEPSPEPTPPPAGSGTGLTGQYFDRMDLTAPIATRTDAAVNFSWRTGAPLPAMGADTFSVRWTGKVQPQYSGTYTFYTQSDDGTRLWVNGRLLIDDWTVHSTVERSGRIALEAGRQYDIRLEYFDNAGGATVRLLWSSSATPKAPVPQQQLYPSASGSPSPSPSPGDAGTGLTATYFDTTNFSAPVATRIDPRVAFNWGTGAPIAGMGADTFSIRWTGKVKPLRSETYTFYTVSDDAIRVWVNGRLLIDDWIPHAPHERWGSIALQAGQLYDIRVDYYESSGGALARLAWSSPSTPKAIIPQSQLFAGTTAAPTATTEP